MLPLIILAISPAILWAWCFYLANRYKRASARLLFALFFAGLGAALLALTLNHMVEKYSMFWPEAMQAVRLFGHDVLIYQTGFWFMVGFNEEFAKLCALLLLAYPSRDFQERFDGILYAAMVALGFATIENFVYLDRYGSPVLVVRSIVTLPAHAFMSAPMGYFLAKSRFQLPLVAQGVLHWSTPIFTILQGWAISAFLHGLYNFLLSLEQTRLAYLQIVLMGIGVLGLAWLCARQSPLSPLRRPVPEVSSP